MAIKKIERKPLRAPEDWIKKQQEMERKGTNIEDNIAINKGKDRPIAEIIDNRTVFKNDLGIDDECMERAEELEKVDEELSICYKTEKIVFDGGKTANLLRVGIPERNIDTNNIILPITTKYLNKTIEMRVPRDKVMVKKEIIKLSLYGANVREENAKYHIKSIEYQEQKIGKFNDTHVELGYSEHNGEEIFKLYKAINIDSKYVGGLDIKPRGDLYEYLNDIKSHVVPYRNMSLAFALGASSAVVAKLNKSCEDINTLLAHFVTESSKGKSTATMLAISIWGNPKLGSGGLYNTWNSTENALITSLAGNYGVAYALDELSMSKIEDTTSLIYNIVGGKDKARLTKEIEVRKSGTWVTTIISNGEASILGKAKNNTGLEVRVLELDGVVWTEDAKHSDEVKALTNRNYGVFGYSFAEKLTKFPIEKLKLLYKEEKKIFVDKLGEIGIVDSIIERTASKYAVVILTAKLINSGYRNYGISLDIEGIRELFINTEIISIQRRGIQNKAEDWLLQYIEANASKFKCGKESNTNVDYWGARRELPNGEVEISILKHKFEEIMKQGKFEDTRVVLDQLKKEGKLDYEGGRLTRKRKINAIITPVYVIKLKL